MSIAEQLSMLNTDEALEITPKSLRLRKLVCPESKHPYHHEALNKKPGIKNKLITMEIS